MDTQRSSGRTLSTCARSHHFELRFRHAFASKLTDNATSDLGVAYTLYYFTSHFLCKTLFTTCRHIGRMRKLHVVACSGDTVQASQIPYRANRLGIPSKALRSLIVQCLAACLLEIKQFANCILHVVDHQIVKVR